MLSWVRRWMSGDKKILVAQGRAYIRPVGRGIVFEEGEHKDEYLSDLIEVLNEGEGYGYLRVRVEWIPEK